MSSDLQAKLDQSDCRFLPAFGEETIKALAEHLVYGT